MEGARSKCPVGRYLSTVTTCADPESFLVDEGRIEDPNITTISGPSLARKRNAIKMAFRWRTDNDPKWNTGFVAL